MSTHFKIVPILHPLLILLLSARLGAAADPPAPVERPAKPLIAPTSGTPQSATPRAVATFESIGLYWTPADGAESKVCKVRYRASGEEAWHEALPLWFDKRIGEYRGSIVQLHSNTHYEVHLELSGSAASADLKTATWSEER